MKFPLLIAGTLSFLTRIVSAVSIPRDVVLSREQNGTDGGTDHHNGTAHLIKQLRSADETIKILEQRLSQCQTEAVCPDGFALHVDFDTCIKFVQPDDDTNVTGWWEARDTCSRLHPFAHLLTLESAEEYMNLMINKVGLPDNLADVCPPDNFTDIQESSYWIGGYHGASDQGFVWGSSMQPVDEQLAKRIDNPEQCGSSESYLYVKVAPCRVYTSWYVACAETRMTPVCQVSPYLS